MVLLRSFTLWLCVFHGSHVSAVPDGGENPETSQYVLINDYQFSDQSALESAVKDHSWHQTKDDPSSYWSNGTYDAGKLNASVVTYVYSVGTAGQGAPDSSLSRRDDENKHKNLRFLGFIAIPIAGGIGIGGGLWYKKGRKKVKLPDNPSLTEVNIGSCGGCTGNKPNIITQPDKLAEIIPSGSPVKPENVPIPPEPPAGQPIRPPPEAVKPAPEITLKDPLPRLKPPPDVGRPPSEPIPPPSNPKPLEPVNNQKPPPPSDINNGRPPEPPRPRPGPPNPWDRVDELRNQPNPGDQPTPGDGPPTKSPVDEPKPNEPRPRPGNEPQPPAPQRPGPPNPWDKLNELKNQPRPIDGPTPPPPESIPGPVEGPRPPSLPESGPRPINDPKPQSPAESIPRPLDDPKPPSLPESVPRPMDNPKPPPVQDLQQPPRPMPDSPVSRPMPDSPASRPMPDPQAPRPMPDSPVSRPMPDPQAPRPLPDSPASRPMPDPQPQPPPAENPNLPATPQDPRPAPDPQPRPPPAENPNLPAIPQDPRPAPDPQPRPPPVEDSSLPGTPQDPKQKPPNNSRPPRYEPGRPNNQSPWAHRPNPPKDPTYRPTGDKPDDKPGGKGDKPNETPGDRPDVKPGDKPTVDEATDRKPTGDEKLYRKPTSETDGNSPKSKPGSDTKGERPKERPKPGEGPGNTGDAKPDPGTREGTGNTGNAKPSPSTGEGTSNPANVKPDPKKPPGTGEATGNTGNAKGAPKDLPGQKPYKPGRGSSGYVEGLETPQQIKHHHEVKDFYSNLRKIDPMAERDYRAGYRNAIDERLSHYGETKPKFDNPLPYDELDTLDPDTRRPPPRGGHAPLDVAQTVDGTVEVAPNVEAIQKVGTEMDGVADDVIRQYASSGDKQTSKFWGKVQSGFGKVVRGLAKVWDVVKKALDWILAPFKALVNWVKKIWKKFWSWLTGKLPKMPWRFLLKPFQAMFDGIKATSAWKAIANSRIGIFAANWAPKIASKGASLLGKLGSGIGWIMLLSDVVDAGQAVSCVFLELENKHNGASNTLPDYCESQEWAKKAAAWMSEKIDAAKSEITD